LRRQTTTSRVAPAGSGRDERLDPFGLPLQFELAERAGDECMRLVELRRERVVLRRVSRGIKMALNLPVAAYLGVAIRLEPAAGTTAAAVALVLEHPDPAFSLTLYRAADGTDIVAEWRAWGRALGVPLLVAEPDGRLREPFDRLAVFESARRSRDDDDAPRCGGAARRCHYGDGRARRPLPRSFIAVVARSSRTIDRVPRFVIVRAGACTASAAHGRARRHLSNHRRSERT
jgi:Family of unknown function (DUF6101)